MTKRLTKGLEEEVYTGSFEGEVIGLAPVIAADLPNFECEPDNRNVEYITKPYRSYDQLSAELASQRLQLREYLKPRDLTLVPGGTLSLGDSTTFHRSKPEAAYHDWIEKTYGTNVVTASNHINIGIEDREELMRVWRVIRCEASLFLALTACSPFIDGKTTGYHSWRWHMFPKTPDQVPLFENYAAYLAFVNEQMAAGVMQNIRHLWLSVRPNGNHAPEQLDRLELRVVDRVPDLERLIAVTALFEARVWQVLEDPAIEPLNAAVSGDALVAHIAANEEAASKSSLDAQLYHWQSGEKIPARDWISSMLDQLLPVAESHGFAPELFPIRNVLQEGNTAMQWIARNEAGESIESIIRDAIKEFSA
jgi:predicted glutamate--cysteine ligase